MKALLVVDIQNDFVEGGSLPVSGGLSVASKINKLINDRDYPLVVTTQDWHKDPGTHFSDSPDFIDSWPVHCEAGKYGAELVRPLEATLRNFENEVVRVYKGEWEASYSGFDGRTEDGRSLEEALRKFGITAVDVVGLAEDYCVFETASDALKAGFEVTVLQDFTASINPERAKEKRSELEKAGAIFIEG